MARTTTGARYRLGPDLMNDLADFCVAQDGAPEIQVIRTAVREYLDRRLSEPEVRRRWAEARQNRLAHAEHAPNVVRLGKSGKKPRRLRRAHC